MWEVSGRKQYDGFWFANVCNVEIGYSYYFQVFNTDSGLACNRLSLGGREMSFFSLSSNLVSTTVRRRSGTASRFP